MELIDLVNEKDEVVGVTTKEKSHTNREIHRIVAIYVFNSEGKLFIQEHLKSNGKFDHSVGGHVNQGESYDHAAEREAYEELGITDPLRHITTFYPREIMFNRASMHTFAIYEVSPNGKWKFIPNEEVKTIIPYSLEEVVEMMNNEPDKFVSGFIRTMKKYLELKKIDLKINH